MSKYSKLYTSVPQTEALDPKQVKNNAGGFVYKIPCWARLDRFLVLGSDANTYYQKARTLTRENAAVVQECLDTDAQRTIDRIVEISQSGRAPKNDPAIFALALATMHKDQLARQKAYTAVNMVCRTATHLFQFVDTARGLGKGWGRGMKRAVANWYSVRPTDSVAFQAIKYRQREGYTHRRLLQTVHPHPGDDKARNALYAWICGKEVPFGDLPQIVQDHSNAMRDEIPVKLPEFVAAKKLPWEAIPTEALRDPEVWKVMIPDMGLTALIRNLGNMTEVGALKPLTNEVSAVADRISSEDDLKRARIHPFNVLNAQATYASGRGFRGNKTWAPDTQVIDALDDAFYKSFQNVVPTGKNFLLGLDVSSSMTAPIFNSALSCREATAALSLITMKTEKNVHTVGFTSVNGRYVSGRGAVAPLDISSRMRLDSVVKKMAALPFGRTDCALPMIYAEQNKLDVDAFVIYTDNETWHGNVHPVQALRDYRKAMNKPNAKLAVVGMTSTGFSIADPDDPGMLDVVGFDAACPALISDFIRDEIAE